MKAESPVSVRSPRGAIHEAAHALSNVVLLQKDLVLLTAEDRVWRQLRKLTLTIGALLGVGVMLTLSFAWIQLGLFLNGWPVERLALMAFLFFGALSGLLGIVAYRLGGGTYGAS